MHVTDTITEVESWEQFLLFVKKQLSATAFQNWFASVHLLEANGEEIVVAVPNIFVKEYILTNYKHDLAAFLPTNPHGEPAVRFVIDKPKELSKPKKTLKRSRPQFNPNYTFESFIEGPMNQFVKSASIGVAKRPGTSYNPLFIWGGVGRGKTHLLHSIGHALTNEHPKLRVHYITIEGFINALVDSLRHKNLNQMKRFYRDEVDVLLLDDMQFLQNRVNFEEELCNTLEALIQQGKQIVITSDKPPAQLELSERIVGRMEWGLVANIGVPDLETRVAIIQHKAQLKGIEIPQSIAFFMAEHIYQNVRQLEGAVNKLTAHSRLLNMEISEQMVRQTLHDMLEAPQGQNLTVDEILHRVSDTFDIPIKELKGKARHQNVVLPRQVAMYLACKMVGSTLESLADCFGKSHSTLLHACKSIEKKMQDDPGLKRKVSLLEELKIL